MSNEAKQAVQAGLDRRKAERIFNAADKEAIGVVSRKNENQRKQAVEAVNRAMQARADEIKAQQDKAAAAKEKKAARQEEELECLHDLKKASMVAAGLCAMGSLYIVAPHIPDAAYTAGGLLVVAGLFIVGLALACWRWRRW